jgi:two-component system chemotaxis response regulator CheB
MAPELKTPFPRAAFDVVVMAASAGGLRAVSTIVAELPRDFPACVLLVQHLDRRHRSLMADILGRRTAMEVCEATAGAPIRPSVFYTAPPDRHLLLNPDLTLLLAQTELVHFVRPSADLLFESAAACCRDRTLGVVLTGTGSDGNMGITAIKKKGGTVIVEDPATAESCGMPEAALRTGRYDFVLPLADVANALCKLVIVPPEGEESA